MGGRFAPGGDRLDGAYSNPFVNLADVQPANDGNAGGQGFGQFLRGNGQPILFTPRVSLAAASYPAIAGLEDEGAPSRSASPTELQRGTGVYETTMRITSGAYAGQGSVINRFA